MFGILEGWEERDCAWLFTFLTFMEDENEIFVRELAIIEIDGG